jgi:uncharacterized protein with HEPN domain
MSRDDAYLLDMLVAARKACAFCAEAAWERFEEDELLQNATIRMLEIIGEAAARISAQTKAAHPEVPWKEVIGMRHRLVHEYFRINSRTVWETVQNDLPRLVAAIEPLVPPATQAPGPT